MNVNGIWKCVFCFWTYISLRDLMGHINLHHNDGETFNVMCCIANCSKEFTRYKSFYQHVQRVHINHHLPNTDIKRKSSASSEVLVSSIESHCSTSDCNNQNYCVLRSTQHVTSNGATYNSYTTPSFQVRNIVYKLIKTIYMICNILKILIVLKLRECSW